MKHKRVGRREFLTTAAGSLLASALPFGRVSASTQVPFSAGSGRPKTVAPVGACDCHHHIYDSRYPVDPTAKLRPPDAKVADYRLLQARLGTSRDVIVTPSTYGTDNSCTLDAIKQIGPEARGIAVVAPSVSDAELKRLAAGGIRGIRFNISRSSAVGVDAIEPLAKRIADHGWHVQLNMPAAMLLENEATLRRLPVAIVFDHLARVPPASGSEHPSFVLVRRLIDEGRAWVKLTGVYLDSKVGPPMFADTSKVASAFIAAAPERVVWGSDWPHPTASSGEHPYPDDAALFDLFAEWTPSEALRRRILVDNPTTLYGFPPVRS